MTETDEHEPAATPSLVELTRNSRGVNWRVRITVGTEEEAVDEALEIALRIHGKLERRTGPPFAGAEPGVGEA